jgi:hypothetical protein
MDFLDDCHPFVINDGNHLARRLEVLSCANGMHLEFKLQKLRDTWESVIDRTHSASSNDGPAAAAKIDWPLSASSNDGPPLAFSNDGPPSASSIDGEARFEEALAHGLLQVRMISFFSRNRRLL